ncbi:hypothetical protein MTO96_011732 [Rhipicephalus appendiculatus]
MRAAGANLASSVHDAAEPPPVAQRPRGNRRPVRATRSAELSGREILFCSSAWHPLGMPADMSQGQRREKGEIARAFSEVTSPRLLGE